MIGSGLDTRWLVIFIAQIVVGAALTFNPPTRDFGLMLIGSALGQGATANMKAVKE
jgi:hypothetical protein